MRLFAFGVLVDISGKIWYNTVILEIYGGIAEIMAPTRTITPKKRAVFCISVVLFAGILMLGLNFLMPVFVLAPLFMVFGEGIQDIEWLWQLIQCGYSLLLLLLVGAFLLIVFRKNPLSGFAGAPSTPRYPFLFLPAAVGLMYLFNIIIGTVFEGPLAPFDLPVDASSFPQTPVGITLYFVMSVLIPGIFEEWLFRGIMQKNLATAIGRKPAIFLTALIFGFMHLEPAQSAFAFVFGLFLGYTYDKTGSIWYAVLMHIFNNAVASAIGYWTYVYNVEWVQIAFGLYSVLMICVGVIAIPVYIVSMTQNRPKLARKTPEERLLPSYGTVAKLTACNPLLYVMIGAYVLILWLIYFKLV